MDTSDSRIHTALPLLSSYLYKNIYNLPIVIYNSWIAITDVFKRNICFYKNVLKLFNSAYWQHFTTPRKYKLISHKHCYSPPNTALP